jgi:hypothetical protein
VSCSGYGAIGTLNHDRSLRHGRGMAPPLFLLSCYCSLVRGTNPRHPLRFLHGRGNRESGRLARRSPVVVRTSSFSWRADGEGASMQSARPMARAIMWSAGVTSSAFVPTPGAVWAWHPGGPWSNPFFLFALFWAAGTLASNWRSPTGDYAKARRALGNP